MLRYLCIMVLVLCALAGTLFAMLAFAQPNRSAVHETEGLIGVLIVAVCAAAGHLGAKRV